MANQETLEQMLARHARELATFPTAAQTPLARAWKLANEINANLGLPELTYGDMRNDVWPAFGQIVNDIGYRKQREAIKRAEG